MTKKGLFSTLICFVLALLMLGNRFISSGWKDVGFVDLYNLQTSHSDFEEIPNCTVGFQTSNTRIRNEQPSCSWDSFKSYFRRTGTFYGEGMWYKPSNASYDDITFYPKDCNMPHRLDSSASVLRCLVQKNISHIVFTGDSTFKFFVANFISWINNTGHGQIKVQEVSLDKDVLKYFSTRTISSKQIQIAGCGPKNEHCTSRQIRCSFKNTSWILRVDYIRMWSLIDGTLRIVYEHHGSSEVRNLSAESKLEYLLKYYFPANGFPDIWLYGASIHHEAWKHSYADYEADMLHVFYLLDKYLPNSTQLIFETTARECPLKAPPDVGKSSMKLWNASRNARIHEMNNILARNLHWLINNHSNYQAFVDGMRLSCPIECHMHRDGPHMKDSWYQMLSSYFMELTCEG